LERAYPAWMANVLPFARPHPTPRTLRALKRAPAASNAAFDISPHSIPEHVHDRTHLH
jgi:hypothetical protein